MFALKSSAEQIVMRIYEGTDYTGGDTVSLFNRNRNSANTLQSALTVGATGTDKGTNFITHAVFASSTGANIRPQSGSSTASVIIDTSKKYLVEIENTEASATDVELSIIIFEIPEGA